MRSKSNERYQQDALKLFRSMGSFGATGRLTTGEEGNTPNIINEILSAYTNKADLKALEEAYEKIYLESGTIDDLLSKNPEGKVTFAQGLKGEFSGQEALVKRLKGLAEGEKGLSLLELDLKDEGRELTTTFPGVQRPFKIYTEAKKDKPDLDPRLAEYQKYIDELPDDDPAKSSFINQPAGLMSVEDELSKYEDNDDLLKAYNDGDLSAEATSYMDMLTRNVNQTFEDDTPTAYGLEDDEIVSDKMLDQNNNGISDYIEAPQENTIVDQPKNMQQPNFLDKLGKVGMDISRTLGLVQQIRNQIKGPDDLMLAALGEKAFIESMKQVPPTKLPGLSNQFKAHLEQTKQLSKMGFSPEEARKARLDIDNAYQKGLENSVRGTAGDRAKFLAMSGVLDTARASALLDFAAKDAELNRQNQDKYTRALSFAEEFELNKSKAEQTADLQMALENKRGASNFASKVFSSLQERSASRTTSPYYYQLTSMLQDDIYGGGNNITQFTTPGITKS
tara:strand:+ start:14025 stop:15545 length:1521 start_codon:yes stop_codon:yes gene_type:complete